MLKQYVAIKTCAHKMLWGLTEDVNHGMSGKAE